MPPTKNTSHLPLQVEVGPILSETLKKISQFTFRCINILAFTGSAYLLTDKVLDSKFPRGAQPPETDPSPIRILEKQLENERWNRIKPGLFWTTDEDEKGMVQQNERIKLIIDSLAKMHTEKNRTEGSRSTLNTPSSHSSHEHHQNGAQ